MSKMFKSKQPVDWKKLQAKLFDTKKDCFSRLRYLKDLLATKELSNEKQFFYNHRSVIYQIFFDAFIQMDASKTRGHSGSGKSSGFGSISELIGPDGLSSSQREEFELILFALNRLLLLLPEVLEQRWQLNALVFVFRKMLHYSNVLRVRTEGMRLFLIYFQILGERTVRECPQLEVLYASLVPGVVADLCPNLSPRNIAVISGPITSSHLSEPPDLSGGANGALPPGSYGPVQAFPNEPFIPMMDMSSSAHIVSSPSSFGGNAGANANYIPQFEYKVEIQKYFLEHLLEYSLSEANRIVWTDYRDRRSLRAFDFLMATFCRLYLPYLFPKMAVLANPDASTTKVPTWPLWTVHPTISVYNPPSRVPSLRRYSDHLKTYFVYAPPSGTQLNSLVHLQTVVILWFTKYLMDKEKTDGGRGDTLTQSNVHLGYGGDTERVSNSSSAPAYPTQQHYPNNNQQPTSSSSPSDAFAREYIRYLLNSRRLYVDLILSLFHETLLLPFLCEAPEFLATSSSSFSNTLNGINRTPMRNVIKVFRQWIHKETTSPLPVFLADPPAPLGSSTSTSSTGSSPPVHSIGRYQPAADDSVAAGLMNLLNVFILSSANVFLLEIPREENQFLELQVDVCKRVFNIYRFMVMKVDMDRTVWENLVQVLIQVTRSIVSSEIPLKREDTLGGRLAPALFQTLIVTWIKANLNVAVSSQLWEQFSTLVGSLTRWEELINEWSATMYILNRVMSRYVFNINLSDLPLDKVSNQDRKKRMITARAAAGASSGALVSSSQATSSAPRMNNGSSNNNNVSRTDGTTTAASSTRQQNDSSQGTSAAVSSISTDRQHSISSTTSKSSNFARQSSSEMNARNHRSSGSARRRGPNAAQNYLLAAWQPNGAVQRHRAFHETSSVLKLVAASSSSHRRLISMSDSCLVMSVQAELCPLKRCNVPAIGSRMYTPFGASGRSKRSSTKSSTRQSPKIGSSAGGRQTHGQPNRHMPMIDDDDLMVGYNEEEAVESCTIVDADDSVTGGGAEFGDYSDASSTVDSTVDAWDSVHHQGASANSAAAAAAFNFSGISGKPKGLYRSYSAEDVYSLAGAASGAQMMSTVGRNWSVWSESLSLGQMAGTTDGGSLKDQPLGFDMGTSGTSSTCSSSVTEAMGVSGMNGGSTKSPTDCRPVLLGGSHKGWNAEISVVLWRRMLGVLGDLNDIPDPAMHKLAFECLVKITDDLLKLKDNITYLVNSGCPPGSPGGVSAITLMTTTTTTGDVQPSLHYFTAWLFRATTLPNEFKAGKLLAYKLLCIIALHKGEESSLMGQGAEAKNKDFLILFYLAIKRALATYDMELTCIIIKYCGQKFFSSALHGSSCLLFDFISAANMIVSSQETKWPRAEALHLLGSLIGFFEVYSNVLILRNTTSMPSLETYRDLKEHVLEILIIASKREQTGLGRSIALCSLGIFLYKEFQNRSEHHRLKEIVNILIAGTRVSVKRPKMAASPRSPSPNHLDNTSKFNNRVLCRVACDQLRLQTDHAAYLVERHPDMARRIIEGLCYTLSLHIEVVQQQNIFREFKNLLIAIQFTLAQWCMSVSKEYLQGTAISRDYPTFVDAENNAKVSDSPQMNSEDHKHVPQKRTTLLELVISVFSTIANINVLDIIGRRFTDRQMDGLNSNFSFSDMDTIDYTITNSDGLDGGAKGSLASDARSADATTVKRAAQCILNHFLTFIGHFPVPKLRTTSLCALINEADDNPAMANGNGSCTTESKLEMEALNSPNVLMFVVNGCTVVSFVELAPDALDSSLLTKLLTSSSRYSSTSSLNNQTIGSSSSQLNLIKQRPIRIIIRNLLGKFSWNAVALASPLLPTEVSQRNNFNRQLRPEPVIRSIATASNGHYHVRSSTGGIEQQQQCFSNCALEDGGGSEQDEDDDQVGQNHRQHKDSLEQVLGEIFEATPECQAEVPERGSFLQELNGTSEAADIVALFTNQHYQESKYMEEQRFHQRQRSLSSSVQMIKNTDQQSNVSQTSSVNSASTSNSIFSDPSMAFVQCRQLIEQTGFLSWEKRSSIDLLASRSQAMLRELRHLDNQRCRETHKIAVIYVALGQESKEAILGNKAGSRAFEEFVGRLGWEVNLASHAGFMGGLESNLSTGLTAPYFADSFNEVIFHVSTRLEPVAMTGVATDSSVQQQQQSNGNSSALQADSGISSSTSNSGHQPISPERSQQLNKKMRHLGNDEVHIVWSEHYKEYRRTLLATEFCDALIVIYPLPSASTYPNLYRIAVSRKPEVPFFGPLFNGVVVHRDELAALVRATAINASKAKRLYMSAYKHYFEERYDCISSLASRHRERSTFEEYATRIYSPRYDLLPTSADGGDKGSAELSLTIEGFLANTSNLLERSPSNADSLSIASSTTNTASISADQGHQQHSSAGGTPTQPTTPQFGSGHHQQQLHHHHSPQPQQTHSQLSARSPSSTTGASRPTSRTSFK